MYSLLELRTPPNELLVIRKTNRYTCTVVLNETIKNALTIIIYRVCTIVIGFFSSYNHALTMVIQIVVNDCDLGMRHILGEDITIFWQYRSKQMSRALSR